MSSNGLVWTPEMEVSLFYAMIDHKPVGENKNFHMIFIYEKFNSQSERKVSIDQIWQHLNTLYDLKALDENEVMPFPSDDEDFTLPESYFSKSPNDSESSKISNTSSKPATTTNKSSKTLSTSQSLSQLKQLKNKK